MQSLEWPDYAKKQRRLSPLAYLKVLGRRDYQKIGLRFFLAWSLYVVGLLLPLPWVRDLSLQGKVIESWPLLLISDFFTGGALERGSVLAGGLWVLLLHTSVKMFVGKSMRSASYLFLWLAVAILTTLVFQFEGRLVPGIVRWLITVGILFVGQIVIFLIDHLTRNDRDFDLLLVNCAVVFVVRLAPAVSGFSAAAAWWQWLLLAMLIVLVIGMLRMSERQRASFVATCVKDARSFRHSTMRLATVSRKVLLGLCEIALLVFAPIAYLIGQFGEPLQPATALVLSSAIVALLLSLGSPIVRLLCGSIPEHFARTLQENFWVIQKAGESSSASPPRTSTDVLRSASPPSIDPTAMRENTSYYRVGLETTNYLKSSLTQLWHRSVFLFVGGLVALFAANLLVLSLNQTTPVIVFYGPIVQLWVVGTLISAGASLVLDIQSSTQLDEWTQLKRKTSRKPHDSPSTEIEGLNPARGIDTQLEMFAEGIFSQNPSARNDALRDVLGRMRGEKGVSVRRFLVGIAITVAVTLLLITCLFMLGFGITDVNAWIIFVPFAFQLASQYIVEFLSSRAPRD